MIPVGNQQQGEVAALLSLSNETVAPIRLFVCLFGPFVYPSCLRVVFVLVGGAG